jgi:hypothetical protein
VGQFKRGKSTLLDALLGEPILPIGVLPVTALPTVVRFGQERRARVRFTGENWVEIAPDRIHEFASEIENPGNRKSVEAIELMLPAPVLSNGLCLVDTPGLGSVNDWNSEATREFVPQVDVALLVTGADPPITGDELNLVELLLDRTPRLMVVMNKADLSPPGAIAEATEFTRRAIRERCNRAVEDVFVANARAHLDGIPFQDDWELLLERLTSVAAESRGEIVDAGMRHGVRRIASRIVWSIDEESSMLQRPIDEAKAHIEYLAALAAHVAHSIGDLRQILLAEQARIIRVVEEDRERFVVETQPKAEAELRNETRNAELRGGSLRRHVTRVAQTIAERHLEPWLAAQERRVADLYANSGARFADLGRDFLSRLVPASDTHLGAAELLVEMPALGGAPRYQYRRFESVAMEASPIRIIGDVLRSMAGARGGIERDARNYIAKLVEVNASRIEFDLRERLDDSRGRFEAELLALLRDILSSARRNLHRTRDLHVKGLPAVEQRLAELRLLKEEAESIRDSANQAASGLVKRISGI